MCLNISFQNAKQQGNVTHFSVNKIRSLWKARKNRPKDKRTQRKNLKHKRMQRIKAAETIV